MNNFNEALLFPMSDAMQVPLYLINGVFRANKEQSFSVGPWNLKARCVGRSDELGSNRASLLIHLRRHLWIYVMCDQQGNRLRSLLVDGDKVGLRGDDDADTFCTGDTKKTMNRLGAGIVAAFDFQENKWSPIDVTGDLVQRFAD